jgi:hypothetical protein
VRTTLDLPARLVVEARAAIGVDVGLVRSLDHDLERMERLGFVSLYAPSKL